MKYTLEEFKNMHVVEIMEMDRFSYPKVDDKKVFNTKEEAIAFCNDYNSKNTYAVSPDWYMVAHYKGKAL
jgi:hypothetical protein